MLKGNNNFSAIFYVVRRSVCRRHWPWLWRRGSDPLPPWPLADPNSHVHVPPGGQHPPHQPAHRCLQQHIPVRQCNLSPGVDVPKISGEWVFLGRVNFDQCWYTRRKTYLFYKFPPMFLFLPSLHTVRLFLFLIWAKVPKGNPHHITNTIISCNSKVPVVQFPNVFRPWETWITF